jgi:hypothetical protein
MLHEMMSAFRKTLFVGLLLLMVVGLVVPAPSLAKEPATPDRPLVERIAEVEAPVATLVRPADEPRAEYRAGGYPMLTAQQIFNRTGRFPDLDGRAFGTSSTRVSLNGYPSAERGGTIDGEPTAQSVSTDAGYPALQP